MSLFSFILLFSFVPILVNGKKITWKLDNNRIYCYELYHADASKGRVVRHHQEKLIANVLVKSICNSRKECSFDVPIADDETDTYFTRSGYSTKFCSPPNKPLFHYFDKHGEDVPTNDGKKHKNAKVLCGIVTNAKKTKCQHLRPIYRIQHNRPGSKNKFKTFTLKKTEGAIHKWRFEKQLGYVVTKRNDGCNANIPLYRFRYPVQGRDKRKRGNHLIQTTRRAPPGYIIENGRKAFAYCW